MHSPDNCEWRTNRVGSPTMSTIPENTALGEKVGSETVLPNNLTTKVSNVSPKSPTGAGKTRSSLSVSFFIGHAGHGGVDGGSTATTTQHVNNNNNNEDEGGNDDDSEYFLPHLMRAASQDDDDDVSGSFVDGRSDNTTSLSTSTSRIPLSPPQDKVEEGE